MIRVKALNFPYNFCFTGPVHVRDVIVARFQVDGDGVYMPELAAHDFAGRVGGFDCYIYYRMRHG
jgi:hypothetical protein